MAATDSQQQERSADEDVAGSTASSEHGRDASCEQTLPAGNSLSQLLVHHVQEMEHVQADTAFKTLLARLATLSMSLNEHLQRVNDKRAIETSNNQLALLTAVITLYSNLGAMGYKQKLQNVQWQESPPDHGKDAGSVVDESGLDYDKGWGTLPGERQVHDNKSRSKKTKLLDNHLTGLHDDDQLLHDFSNSYLRPQLYPSSVVSDSAYASSDILPSTNTFANVDKSDVNSYRHTTDSYDYPLLVTSILDSQNVTEPFSTQGIGLLVPSLHEDILYSPSHVSHQKRSGLDSTFDRRLLPIPIALPIPSPIDPIAVMKSSTASKASMDASYLPPATSTRVNVIGDDHAAATTYCSESLLSTPTKVLGRSCTINNNALLLPSSLSSRLFSASARYTPISRKDSESFTSLPSKPSLLPYTPTRPDNSTLSARDSCNHASHNVSNSTGIRSSHLLFNVPTTTNTFTHTTPSSFKISTHSSMSHRNASPFAQSPARSKSRSRVPSFSTSSTTLPESSTRSNIYDRPTSNNNILPLPARLTLPAVMPLSRLLNDDDNCGENYFNSNAPITIEELENITLDLSNQESDVDI